MTRCESTKVECICAACGVSFLLRPSRIARGQGVYCSRACKHKPRALIPHPNVPGCLIVPLTRGKVALIDLRDAPIIRPYSWSAAWSGKRWYARRMDKKTKRQVLMHRYIMEAPADRDVDHIDGDGLNNRRYNLRLATGTQNAGNCGPRVRNRSGFRGVGWSTKESKWIASIQYEGVKERLGCFFDPAAAARAYDARALELFGEFAHLNFPDDYEAEAA